MTEQEEISGNERFDFYGGHYGRFNDELAAEVRCEVYGEDLGQTGWRTAAEQAEIADYLRLGPDIWKSGSYGSPSVFSILSGGGRHDPAPRPRVALFLLLTAVDAAAVS